MRAGALAECMQSDPSTVSRQVAALVKDGLLERRADPADGRASLLVLTEKADAVLADHDRVRLEYFAQHAGRLERRRPAALRRAARPLHRRLRDRRAPRGSPSGSRHGATARREHRLMAATTAQPVSASTDSGGLTHKQIMTILSGLMLGMFLAALDQTIVSTAIRTIGDDLQRAVRPGVGDDGVPDHLDDLDAAVRQAVRHLRPQAAVHDRDLDLHPGLGAVRARPVDVHARRRSARSRASAPAASCRSRWRSSATSSRRASGRSTRATSWPCSRRRRCSARSSAASSPARTSIFGVTGWRWIFYINVPIGIFALLVVQAVLHARPQPPRPPHRLDGRRRCSSSGSSRC